jgi:hypothetical protein
MQQEIYCCFFMPIQSFPKDSISLSERPFDLTETFTKFVQPKLKFSVITTIKTTLEFFNVLFILKESSERLSSN